MKNAILACTFWALGMALGVGPIFLAVYGTR